MDCNGIPVRKGALVCGVVNVVCDAVSMVCGGVWCSVVQCSVGCSGCVVLCSVVWGVVWCSVVWGVVGVLCVVWCVV